MPDFQVHQGRVNHTLKIAKHLDRLRIEWVGTFGERDVTTGHRDGDIEACLWDIHKSSCLEWQETGWIWGYEQHLRKWSTFGDGSNNIREVRHCMCQSKGQNWDRRDEELGKHEKLSWNAHRTIDVDRLGQASKGEINTMIPLRLWVWGSGKTALSSWGLLEFCLKRSIPEERWVHITVTLRGIQVIGQAMGQEKTTFL